jgi:iron complex outermembrane recepter protein
MTRATLTLLCLIFSHLIFAQSPKGNISGIIADGGDQKIIDAATVSVFRAKDSVLFKAGITDKAGNFLFENVPAGRYYIEATSVGHLKTFSSILDVSASSTVNAGTLQLKSTTRTLKEVTVSGKKPFIERKADRTVVNVDAAISSAGSTALEILEKAPGVTVDKDGNISLKGKQGVLVMMDGRPSYLSGQELTNVLKNMPASAIDQVEIMTNPSSKYDAAGNSGIINIKTKKNKLKGLNGNISAGITQGRYTKTNNSFNINYRKGKVNLFGSYSYSYWQGYEDLFIHRNFRNTVTKDLETIFDQHSNMKFGAPEHNLKVGLDFYANKKTTAGIVLSGFINPSRNNGVNTTLLEGADKVVDSIVVANNSEKGKSNNLSANFNLRHSFDTTGKEFTLDLDYLTYFQNKNQFFENSYLHPDYTPQRGDSQLIGRLPATIHIYSAKTDFTFPLKKSAKIETGVKSSYVTTDNDALYQDNTTAGYITDEGKTNHFIYKENINAAYINYSRQIKKWGLQAGLRAENTNAHGHQVGNASRPDSSFTKNYINLFPTVYLTYEANTKNTFSVNYGRRIDRPDYGDLNPFYYFLDEYTYKVGNTLLQPQFTNNIELSHTYKGFLTTTLNYSVTNNVFTDVLKQITAERKTFQTKENIATRTNVGLAVSAYFPVTKFWTTNIYGNVIRDAYKGALDGGFLNVNSVTFFTNINNQFRFTKGWSAELGGFYRTKGIESQIIIDPLWRLDAGVQKEVLKTKGTIKVGIRDIFASQNFTGKVLYQDIDVMIKNRHDSRSASLTFTYRFGKPLQNQQRRKTGGASDEQNRVKTGS